MLDSILLPLAVIVLLYVGYVIVRAYFPSKRWEPIQSNAAPSVSEPFKPSAIASASAPSPAPMILQDVSDQPPRVVSPGGPNPPNAQALPTPRTRSPEAVPLDPSENENTELPIEDTLRHPELSFGPGTDNTATTMTPASGVGSSFSDQTLSKFSPEFAQNGGAFLGSIFANDTTVGKEYATF